MKPTVTTLLAALLALPLAACDSFYVEADQPLACMTLQPQSVTIPGGGIVAPPQGFTGQWSGQATVAIGDFLPGFILDGPPKDRVVRLVSFGARLTSGGATSFDWLQSFNVSAWNGITSTPLASYQGGLPAGATTINLPSSNPDFNLADYVNAGNLTIDYAGGVSVPGGQAVPANWTGSVNLCIQAHVKKTFNELINP